MVSHWSPATHMASWAPLGRMMMVPAQLQGITVSPRLTGGWARGRHLSAAPGTQIPLQHEKLLLFNSENPEIFKDT